MFKLLKKILGKAEPPAPVPAPMPVVVARAVPLPQKPSSVLETAPRVATVETTSLSLAAIIGRFPPELKATVLATPGPDAMVVLPLSTILKQLPGGSVKMSLASIYRQAPRGTFGGAQVDNKQMVEVPLGEIFKRVRPELLKRRNDQRMHDLAEEEDPDSEVLFAPAPGSPVTLSAKPTTALKPSSPLGAPTPNPPTSLPMAIPTAKPQAPKPDSMRILPPPPGFTGPPAPTPTPAAASIPGPSIPRIEIPSAPATETEAASTHLTIALAAIAASWPEEIQAEISALEGAEVVLPAPEIKAGLAKGKVVFKWGQLREWITPAPEGSSAVSSALELQLPLRVIAPAFLKASREPARKRVVIDEEIPALFAGNQPVAPPSAAAPMASPESASEELASPEAALPQFAPSEPAEESELQGSAEPAPLAPISAPLAFTLAKEPEEQADEQEPEAEPVAAPLSFPERIVPNFSFAPEAKSSAPEDEAAAPSEPEVEQPSVARTVGEIFGQGEKEHWSPAEIVANITRLPEVAGAIVALKEGLVVAHSLPESMKGDVVAAFLPQIFGRLNQYAGEMKLGQIDDLLMSSDGAYFQIFRLGIVFFAVLGKQGQSLPVQELRLIADELLQQGKI